MVGTGCEDFSSALQDNDHCDATPLACTSCHGTDDDPAPPNDLDGSNSTASTGVGAHQSHLSDGNLRDALPCESCHVVPTSITAAGHIGSRPAELVWSSLASQDATPTWDRAANTCTNYCHGATLSGGSNTTPVWTVVDGSQAACGTCHGAPPPPPHVASTDCHACHPGTVNAAGDIDVALGLHINGTVETNALACDSCHGGGGSAAPPVDTAGQSGTDLVTVGAHRSHLQDGSFRRAVACDECHVVPQSLGDVGHVDAAPAEVTWGPLATTDGATGAWDRTTATCGDAYCHGVTLSGGSNTTPQWTVVNGSQAVCGSCHGIHPPPPHPANYNCGLCHVETMGSGSLNLDTHIDGILQVSGSLQCGSCHEVPPATGSHLIHYAAATTDATYGSTAGTADLLPGGGGYAFGCGNCHPTDPAHHGNGVSNSGGGSAEIDLSAAGAPAGSLKSLNGPGASYAPGASVSTDSDGLDYTHGTCSEVYCHSSKVVETPGPIPEPDADFPFTGYPITYPAYTVNLSRAYHDVTWGDSLSCDGCHGFPPRTYDATVLAGAGDSHSFIDASGYENLHGYSHGAAPIPCAACHFDVVTDPGVRYRDTTPPTAGWSVYEPVPIAGHPNHVNGTADVAFTTDPVMMTSNPFDLSGATWESSNRSCVNVSCHFNDTPVVWGTPYRYNVTIECNVCHQF